MRSTQIVQDCCVEEVVEGGSILNVLSLPIIDIPSLSGKTWKPILSELKAVLDLRHLVRYFEHTALDPARVERSWGRGAKHLLDESPHLLPSWREGFYRAAYRSFITGAVLAKFYLDPIINEQKTGRQFLGTLWSNLIDEGEDDDLKITDFPMDIGELDIMNKSPIYNFTLHPDWESCFGPLGEWLVGETRQRLNVPKSDGSQPVEIEGEVLKEVLQLLAFYGQLSDMKGNLLGSDVEPFWTRFWCRHRPAPDGKCICKTRAEDSDTDSEADEEKLRGAKTRTVPVVFLGDYLPQTVELSTDTSEFGEESCMFSLTNRDSPVTMLPKLVSLCGLMHCLSGRPNHVNGHPAPHPPLHLFSFLLRKYFEYQFDELAFELVEDLSVYENFIRQGKIFSSEGTWDGLLTSAIPEHVLSYIKIIW